MTIKLNPFGTSIRRARFLTSSDSSRKSEVGFTLVELMVVVVIIGIIAGVAIPAYRGSIMKANRSAAKSALLDLAAREEKYYTLNNTYAFNSADTNLTTLAQQLYGSGTTSTFSSSVVLNVPATGPTLYTIAAPTVVAATAATPTTFTITATPYGTQVGDQCGSFTINSAGQQTASGTGSCW
jgi:type IV pilus assembly protein PilE